MNYILDTHVALDWINDEKLPTKVSEILEDKDSRLFLSIASAWEIAIKINIGKLKLEGGSKEFLSYYESSPVTIAPISHKHLETYESLPLLHKDPFDRIIVATAIADNLTLITNDPEIHKYDVPIHW